MLNENIEPIESIEPLEAYGPMACEVKTTEKEGQTPPPLLQATSEPLLVPDPTPPSSYFDRGVRHSSESYNSLDTTQKHFNSLTTKKDEAREVVKEKDQRFSKTKAPSLPQRGIFTEEARQMRLSFLKKQTQCHLGSLEKMRLSPKKLIGNIESLIGAVEIPIGVGGPLWIQGQDWAEFIYVPLATTEGALVSSVTRGAKALNYSGGATARVLRCKMGRAPVFDCGSFLKAIQLKDWLKSKFKDLQEKVTEHSNHAKLIELEFRHAGPLCTLSSTTRHKMLPDKIWSLSAPGTPANGFKSTTLRRLARKLMALC